MSDSENKTENKTEAKTADTAPYLKKDKQPANQSESAKSNAVIPLVLLLVSAIVIIATFYEDEYKDLVAQGDSVTDSIEKTETTDIIISTTEEKTSAQSAANESATEETLSEGQVSAIDAQTDAETDETVAAVEVTEKETVKAAPASVLLPAGAVTNVATTGITESAPAESDAESATTMNKEPGQSRYAPYQRPTYADREAYEEARKQAMARAETERKKHNEMMQQRRLAYEKEMQERREQFETMMKAYKEKREKLAETKKAIYQQFEQNRTEAKQKMEQMHKEISELHRQMHQMMRDSQAQMKRAPQPRVQRAPQPEFRQNSTSLEQPSNTEKMQRM
jgi:hypothetical protein